MSGRRTGWLAGVLLILLVLGVGAWLFRDTLLGGWTGSVEYSEVSEAAAASAEMKLERLRTRGDTVRLSAVELASLLRYRVAERYPDLLQNPSAAMSGDTLRVGARFPTERLPELQELERVRPFLPDTTRIDVTGRLRGHGPGRAAMEIDEVAVAGIPIPQRYYPSVLARLGRRDEPQLPANALAFGLPEGVGSARVENGHLVLMP